MTDEDIIDCILEIDKTLSEVEEELESKHYDKAMRKLREARDAIQDLREDDESEDDKIVGFKVMDKLK